MPGFIDSLPKMLAAADFRAVVAAMRATRDRDGGIVWGFGAHVLKVGLGPILIDLMERGFVSALAMNGAGIIHDVEIALAGQTSEDVDAALGKGQFGMSEETGRVVNDVITAGVGRGLGLGQSVVEWLTSVEGLIGLAPEHASLWCPELNVLIAGDQVLPKISTNVGVWPNEPLADALTWFLDGFSRFRRLPADALVLPSHGFPFVGMHTRLDQLVAHHDARLNEITAAIARTGTRGSTGWDMVPVLFPRHLDNNQVVFAFGETLAHLHCLETRARVKRIVVDGVHRFVALLDTGTSPSDDSETEMMDTGTA